MAKTLYVNLNAGTGNLEVTQDPLGVNNLEIYPKDKILSVIPVKMQVPGNAPDDAYWIYPFPTMTMVTVNFVGECWPALKMELQSVSNQPGWSTGTQAGIDQCVADFAAFI